MPPSINREKLQELADQTRLSNCHTHMTTVPAEGGRIPGRPADTPFDLTDLIIGTYVGQDLVSAGMNWMNRIRSSYDPDHDPEVGWNAIAPYLDRVHGTTYYRSVVWGCRELYGFDEDEITESNWRALSEKISESGKQDGWGEHLINDYCRYAVSLHGTDDVRLHSDYFAEILPVAQFLCCVSPTEAQIKEQLKASHLSYEERALIAQSPRGFIPAEEKRAEFDKNYGRPESIDDILEAMDQAFAEFKERGAVGIKIQTAYYRRIYFSEVDKSEADRIFAMRDDERSLLDNARYQDFAIHEVIKRAAAHKMAIQIHTGIQAGHGNYTDNSNPRYLANLFFAYPDARFDVFHGGYPFCGEMGVLAKTFPNVYLNFCWMPLITMTGTKRALREWIETVPGNKLLWGDDCHHVESCVNGALLGRKVVAETIAEMVDDDYICFDTGADLLDRILYRNAIELYDFQREYR